ncbi:hypothetical protein GY45DRAFT_1329825 [Cubamyces sp. BRFM 1775]|nr:hypothetical protein GY45DRAFT_1329825 [Cubamyces sp. BRFM 1775]
MATFSVQHTQWASPTSGAHAPLRSLSRTPERTPHMSLCAPLLHFLPHANGRRRGVLLSLSLTRSHIAIAASGPAPFPMLHDLSCPRHVPSPYPHTHDFVRAISSAFRCARHGIGRFRLARAARVQACTESGSANYPLFGLVVLLAHSPSREPRRARPSVRFTATTHARPTTVHPLSLPSRPTGHLLTPYAATRAPASHSPFSAPSGPDLLACRLWPVARVLTAHPSGRTLTVPTSGV